MRINGYPQEQKTWARVSGYVEQSDIHSPQVILRARAFCICSKSAAYNATAGCLQCQCLIQDGRLPAILTGSPAGGQAVRHQACVARLWVSQPWWGDPALLSADCPAALAMRLRQ